MKDINTGIDDFFGSFIVQALLSVLIINFWKTAKFHEQNQSWSFHERRNVNTEALSFGM